MSDLIERLRLVGIYENNFPVHGTPELCASAADEIERLRRELADADASDKESLSLYHACRDRADGYLAQIAQLERELAEARGLLRDLFADPSDWQEVISRKLYDRLNAFLAADQPPAATVGCEREDGTLNIHAETETCEVCASDNPGAAPETQLPPVTPSINARLPTPDKSGEAQSEKEKIV